MPEPIAEGYYNVRLTNTSWLLTVAAFIAGALIVSALVAYIGRNPEE